MSARSAGRNSTFKDFFDTYPRALPWQSDEMRGTGFVRLFRSELMQLDQDLASGGTRPGE